MSYLTNFSIRRLLILAVAIHLTGCSSIDRGAPIIISSDKSDNYLVAANCNNVSEEQVLDSFITNSYLTTWGSVFSEVGRSVMPTNVITSSGLTLLHRMPPERTYCMIYNYSYDEVNEAISATISSLQSVIIKSDSFSGEYETEFVLRAHGDRSVDTASTVWKEKFLIFFTENLVQGTEVRIFRDVLISRERSEENERIFISGTSVGHNEAWYLLQIRSYLQRNFGSR